MKLVSSSAIVTGAGQGIGLAIAAHLMRNGANVLLFGRTREKVEAAAEGLNRTMEGRVRAVPFAGDVVQAADVSRAIETATRELGLPGILVNNAGTGALSPIIDMPEAEFDQILAINLKGPFLFTKALGRALVDAKQPGSIVNISSLNQTNVTDGLAHYCASKAGLANFTKVTASELGRYGIRANIVAPGLIRTPLSEGAGLQTDAMMRAFLEHTPLGKPLGEPEDVAKVVSFLCSDLASWVTGETIAVDGGNHVRGVHSYLDTLGLTSPKVG